MNWRLVMRPRTVVLLLLWGLPILFYVVVGMFALYQVGWFYWMMWTLPPMWLAAWIVGRAWPAPKLHQTAQRQPLTPPSFWTPHDAAAIAVVEKFRNEVADVDYNNVADINRYVRDGQALAEQLAQHYHEQGTDHVLHPLTLVEILAVMHLAVEDLEAWVLKHIPGSHLVTIGQLQKVPTYVNALDLFQKAVFVASAVVNPARLAAYPLWRKSGQVTFELQNELIRTFYQRYLQQLGYYLIEMYSGRLKGGSPTYRDQFGDMASAVHATGGDTSLLDRLEAVSTTVALVGQVKAGKSSLINKLMKDQVAETGVLPETREVAKYEYALPKSEQKLTLLDTPGYSEADVTPRQRQEIRRAAEAADIVLLVLAANVSARDADLQIVRHLQEHYRRKNRLKPPPLIGVLTHIDLLRPIRQWSPPYDWQHGKSAKEQSMAEAVEYLQDLFGDAISDYTCVYTGDTHPADESVADNLVPLLVQYLDQGHSAAVLKAFYRQLNEQRWQQLVGQAVGLVKSIRSELG